jgi:hypothetical protein
VISVLLFAAAAAAASNFAPPEFRPKDVRRVMENYPQSALNAGQSAAALIEAEVDPKGRVTKCNALVGYGDKKLAGSICGIIEGMQIEPAKIQGAAAYGVAHEFVSLFLDDDKGDKVAKLIAPADMELQVNKLPSGKSMVRVTANILVDAAGKPQACYAANDAPQAYADVACTQVSGLTFGVFKDGAGKPVGYVRSPIIDFELASASQATGG